MQDLKKALDEQHQRALMRDLPMAVELELATHQLNHQRRRVLSGLTPCQVYHDPMIPAP